MPVLRKVTAITTTCLIAVGVFAGQAPASAASSGVGESAMTEELASSPQTLKFGELNSGTDHASLGEVVSTSEETVDQTQIDQ